MIVFRFYSLITSVTSSHRKNGLKPIANGHFVNISPSSIPSWFTRFKPVTDQEVICLISTSVRKSCSLYPIPTTLLLQCIDVVLPTITRMINLSFEQG